jgi:hypothetical protein
MIERVGVKKETLNNPNRIELKTVKRLAVFSEKNNQKEKQQYLQSRKEEK